MKRRLTKLENDLLLAALTSYQRADENYLMEMRGRAWMNLIMNCFSKKVWKRFEKQKNENCRIYKYVKEE